MRRTRSFLGLAAAGALVLTACGGGSDDPSGTAGEGTGATQAPDGSEDTDGPDDPGDTGTGETGGTVTMAITDDPGALDPHMTVLSVTRGVARMSYDSLVRLDTEGEVVPNMATDWQVEPTSVTFTLDPDLTCADGEEFTATDAADNINFVADPENASPLLGVILPVGVSAEADDEAGTVTASVAEPDAFLLRAFTSLHMVCRAGLDDRSTLAQDTNGTGPWLLDTVVPNDTYTFTRREGYDWGPTQEAFEGDGVPDTLVYRVIPNLTTTANLLLAGDVQIAAVGPGDEERVQGAGLDVYGVPGALGELFFNQAEGRVGADPEVRRALMAAVDIETVTRVGGGAVGRASTGLVTLEPKVCPGDTVSGNLPEHDPEEARSILESAGWVEGSDGIREKDGQRLAFEFTYIQRGGSELAAAAELMSQQWREVGADVSPQVIPATQLNEVLFATGNWDAGWIPITVSLPTQLVGFLSGPATPDGTNFAHIANPTYEEKSAEAMVTGEIEAACALWDEAETALIQNLDVVPMFDILANTYLNGVSLDAPNGDIDGASIRTTG